MSSTAASHIRLATIADYEALCDLFVQLDALHIELLPAHFQRFKGPARPFESIKEKIESPDKAIFLACNDSVAVGFADVQKASNPPLPMFKAREFALIDNLFVLPEFRGGGIARSLFEHIRTWAKEHGLGSIQLNVYNSNQAAIRLYEKLGMQPLSTKYELDL